MSANNSVQVGIKIRPNEENKTWLVENNMIKMTEQTDPYCFDYVFDQNITNEEIFNRMAKHIVHAAVKGYNGTIFAYGQTSSGKTYTMIGDEKEPGVMVLSAKEIFSEIEKSSNTRQFLLRGSFIEIYNEKIYDLIKRSDQDLKIHETTNGIPTVNSEELCITNEEELTKMLINGNKERTVGETLMNERSSRSHAIFRLIIESKEMNNEEDGTVTQSVLFLVDLAGSERADQTGATGARLKEGGYINKSLFFLSKVIKELSECLDRKYISFRDSKLTRILQPSLGSNALTSIICTVKPSAIDETQSTLNFALRAKKVKTKPHVNKTVSDATMLKRLNNEIKDLRRQLDEEKQRTTNQLQVVKIKELLHYTELKIINSSSLQHSRIKTNTRRRTWCPDSAHEADTSTSLVESSKLLPSRLKQPTSNNFYAQQFVSQDITNSGPSSRPTSCMAIEEEKFVSGENFDFGALSQCPKTPMGLNIDNLNKQSISPTTKNNDVLVKMLEQELHSLQEFTNLENSMNVEHDLHASLKSKLDELCKRNGELERKQENYILIQNDLDFFEDQYQIATKQNKKLKNENQSLQSEILMLKTRLEEIQRQLLCGMTPNQKSEQNIVAASNHKLEQRKSLEVHNEKEVNHLKEQLRELEEKYDQLQQEYDQLSTTVMDNIDENDTLKSSIEALQKKLNESEQIRLQNEGSLAELISKQKRYSNNRNDDIIKDLEEQLCEVKEKNAAIYESSQQDIKELRNEIKRLTAELFEKSSVLENCSCIEYQKQIEDLTNDKVALTLLNEELQEKMVVSYNSSSSINSSPNKTVLQEKKVVKDTENSEMKSFEEKLKFLEAKLRAKDNECQSLQLEHLQKLELSEEEFRANIRKYNEDWDRKRLEFEQKIVELQKALPIQKTSASPDVKQECEDNGISITNKQEDDSGNSVPFDDFENSSTPTKASERYLEVQKIQEERCQIVTACNDKISMLSVILDENKAVNFELKEALEEKVALISKKDSEIEELKGNMLALVNEKNALLVEHEEKFKELSIHMDKNEELKILNQRCEFLEKANALIPQKDSNLQELNMKLRRTEKKVELIMDEKNAINLELRDALEEKVALIAEKDSEIGELRDNMLALVNEKNALLIEKEEKLKELSIHIEGKEEELKILNQRCEFLEKANALIPQKDSNLQELNMKLRETQSKVQMFKERYEFLIEEKNLHTKNFSELETLKNAMQEATRQILMLKEQCENLVKKVMPNRKFDVMEKLNSFTFDNKEFDSPKDGNKKMINHLRELCKNLFELVEESLSRSIEFDKQERELVECQQRYKDLLNEKSVLEIKFDENLKMRIEAEAEVKYNINAMQVKIKALELQYIEKERKLKQEVTNLNIELENERKSAAEMIETLNLKLEDLMQQLHETKSHAANYDKILLEYENLEKQLETIGDEKSQLKVEVIRLRTELDGLSNNINENAYDNEQLESLQMELLELKTNLKAVTKQKEEQCAEAEKLNNELIAERSSIEYRNLEIQGELKEFKFKCDSLKTANQKLEMKNKEFEQRFEEVKSQSVEMMKLQKQINELQVEKHLLQSDLEKISVEMNNGKEQLQKSEKFNESLKCALDRNTQAITEERKKFKNTISSLQADNKKLSVRLEEVTEETGPSSSHLRPSPVKPSLNVSADEKSSAIQKERKIRRLSTHDKNRRQSSQFEPLVQDVSTMTTQAEKCECFELRKKLNECQTNLYISKSHVTALSLQYRNHPLKQENSLLIQRIEKEQTNQQEIHKRYKNKIDEMSAKIATLTDEIAAVKKQSCKIEIERITCTSPRNNLTTIETQTEFDLDFCLQKLQGKYKDLKTLCRYRYTEIAELNRKLEEKENIAVLSNVNQQQKTSSTTEKFKP